MKNFTTGLISMAFCLALMFSAFTATAQTDERPDYMEQVVPQDAQEMVTPVPDAEKNVSKSEKNSFNPTLLVPPAGKKVKSKKGFFGRMLDKLNPLNWFKSLKAQLSTGVMLMVIGLAMIVIGYILFLALATGSGGLGSFFLGALLIYVGWIVFIIGAVLWLIELIQNS